MTAVAKQLKKASKLNRRVLPGFGLAMGWTLTWLGLIVLIPLSSAFIKSAGMGWSAFVEAAFSPRALASYKVTFGASLAAAVVNGIFGYILAWVLVRYKFPGKRIIDGIIDLPFALPTAVAGIALTAIYSQNGWIGSFFHKYDIRITYTFWGIFIALVFIGLPFVVRTLQPIMEELEPELEEAAATLGANRWKTFWSVIYPATLPAHLTGFALSFARAIGEYGSVVFIAGNMPMKTEITPLLIFMKLEQYDYAGATSIAVVMLLISFTLLLLINVLQRWVQNRGSAQS